MNPHSHPQKVFIYLVRCRTSQAELLVLVSHDEPGFEVPKGSVEPGETLEQAVMRELHEETGITSARIVQRLGSKRWHNELQHFFFLTGNADYPNTFEHRVTGRGMDHGLRYIFQWLPIDSRLASVLVQGCDRFVGELRESIQKARLS